ncbi:MAG: DEAD/DEAH box helicase [Lachnospiraceae bacterium]|nr:DEAD/DEAH box helicase [Lachnospiraceae bacterium]
MIKTKRLVQFYISQYEMQAKKRQKKTVQDADVGKRVERLRKTLKNAKISRVNSSVLEDYHRQIKNILVYALRKKKEELVAVVEQEMIPKLVQLDMGFLLPEQREGIDSECLAFLKRKMPGAICSAPLFSLYPLYRQHQIKSKILDLVPTKPELEFPEALQMKRHFILHIGPTNSGKTFCALERLKTAQNGVYLGPLRLLALEVYEKMKEYRVPCTMLTGQECIEGKDSRVVSSTIEMADYDESYDIAVIDEAQMMADPDRGHAWTKALLGIKAEEIHVCTSPAAEEVLKHLIELCGDFYDVHYYKRKTDLTCEEVPFEFPEHVQEGDALITFSKKSVLDVAGRLEECGIHASVIYGSLPPEIRRRQMHLFTSGRTKVVVSTDAIGMGLNLPVRRIVFLQTEKFDGVGRRPLTISEIRQISGRAGRYGIYDTGYVTAMGQESLDYIREKYMEEEPSLLKVNLGFPQVLLNIDEKLDEILKVWHSVEPVQPFEKENVDEALFLYERAQKVRTKIDGFDNKRLLYRMITCPIDIKDWRVVSLWLDYCQTYSADVSLKRPTLDPRDRGGIMKYETYYKQLDLYYQFSHRMGKIIDEKWLAREREKTEANIMRYLAKDKTSYIVRCQYCGKLLPLGSVHRICDRCCGKEE